MNAPVPPAGNEAALRRLSAMLQLQRRARRAASVEELAFVAVNETHALVPYRQAALFRRTTRGGRIAAVSGLAAADRDAPFVVWAEGAFGAFLAAKDAPPIRTLTAADIPEKWRDGWAGFLPAHAVLIALTNGERRLGALLLARDEAFAAPELGTLDLLAEAYAHAWDGLARGGRLRVPRESGRWTRALSVAGVLAVAALGFVPVSESVLAPAEIVAREPAIVRAALDGVIDRIPVKPNQAVAAGELLVALDDRKLQSQLDIARKTTETAEAELRQALQGAVFDARARASVPVLRGRYEQSAAELAYTQSLLERIEIRAAKPGIVVFDDANDWIGRPVAQGERIMLLADPTQTEFEIRLPVADAIDLPPGAEVRVFLNADPQRALPATLEFQAYRAQPGPDGALAYRLKARPGGDMSATRIGLKGTAKLYGKSVPLALYVFRRPLAALRQAVGL